MVMRWQIFTAKMKMTRKVPAPFRGWPALSAESKPYLDFGLCLWWWPQVLFNVDDLTCSDPRRAWRPPWPCQARRQRPFSNVLGDPAHVVMVIVMVKAGVQYLSFVMTWHDKVFFSQYTWALFWKYRSKIEVKFAINLVLNYLLLIFPTWSEMLMAMVLLLSTKGAITDLSLSAAWFTCKRVVTSLVGSLAKDSEQKHTNTSWEIYVASSIT